MAKKEEKKVKSKNEHEVEVTIDGKKWEDAIKDKSGLNIYNLGTGTGYIVLDLVNSFEKVNGVKVPYKIVDRRPGDIASCYADASKAFKELNWKAELGIEDMMRDSYNYVIKNQD